MEIIDVLLADIKKIWYCYISFFTNTIVFFFLYFNPKIKAGTSTRINILRNLCFLNCLFVFFFIEIKRPGKIDYGQLGEFTDFLSFEIFKGGIDIENMYITMEKVLFSVLILFETYYSIECFQVIQNPISKFSMRNKVYKIVSVFIGLLFFLINFFIHKSLNKNSRSNSNENSNSSPILEFDFLSCILVVFYCFICFYSFFVLIKQNRTEEVNKICFIIRYIAYFLVVIGNSILYFFFFQFSKEPSSEDFSLGHKGKLITFSIMQIILSLFRIIECPFNKSIEELLEEEQEKVLKKIIENEQRLSNLSAEYSSDEALNQSLVFQNNKLQFLLRHQFLSRCMYYAIKGIYESFSLKDFSQLTDFHQKENYEMIRTYILTVNNYEVKEITNVLTIQSMKKILGSKQLFTQISLVNKVEIIEYAPKIFELIGALTSLSKEEFLKSFELEKNIDNLAALRESEGKSGSIFFFTSDSKYIIKSISKKELDSLVNSFLKNYAKLLCLQNSSCLAKIFGAYTLKVGLSQVHFIVMENLTPVPSNLILSKFDFKGSQVGRQTKGDLKDVKNKTLKDQDYLSFKGNMSIEFSEETIQEIKNNLNSDLEVLEKSNLMDYSFYVAKMENSDPNVLERLNRNCHCYLSDDKKWIYLMGIIDYLTRYDNMKLLEHWLLNLFYKKNMASAVDPKFYSKRFFNFLMNKVFCTVERKEKAVDFSKAIEIS